MLWTWVDLIKGVFMFWPLRLLNCFCVFFSLYCHIARAQVFRLYYCSVLGQIERGPFMITRVIFRVWKFDGMSENSPLSVYFSFDPRKILSHASAIHASTAFTFSPLLHLFLCRQYPSFRLSPPPSYSMVPPPLLLLLLCSALGYIWRRDVVRVTRLSIRRISHQLLCSGDKFG